MGLLYMTSQIPCKFLIGLFSKFFLWLISLQGETYKFFSIQFQSQNEVSVWTICDYSLVFTDGGILN